MRTIQTSKQLDLFKQTTELISFNHISNKTSDQSTEPTCKKKDGSALQQKQAQAEKIKNNIGKVVENNFKNHLVIYHQTQQEVV